MNKILFFNKKWPLQTLAVCLLAVVFIANSRAEEIPYRWKGVTVGAGGFAPNVIYSTAEAGLAYLRTDMGGAYRWDEPLQTWVPLQDAMSESNYYGIESLAADPVDPDVVYIAAGMYKPFPAAMLRSADRGSSWEITPVPFRMGGNENGRGVGERLAIDPLDTDVLYFGSRHDGLFKSADRGATWTRVDSFPHKGIGLPEGRVTNAGVSFVVFAPAEDDGLGTRTIFAGVADPSAAGVYRSDDRGKSWRLLDGGPQGLLPLKAAYGGARLFVTYGDGIGPNGIEKGAVYRLDVGDGHWTDVTPPPTGAEGGFMGVSISRQDPDIVAVSTLNRWKPQDEIYRSVDGGNSWTGLSRNSSRDVSEYPFLYWGNKAADFGWWMAGLAINPFDGKELVYTTGATVYRTRDASAEKTRWKPWVEGIEQTAVITLASLPEGPSLLSGFGDISGFVHTDFDRSPQVMFTHPVFANTNVIDYAGQSPNIVVRSGTQPHRGRGDEPTLAWSDDHGFSWKPVTVPELSQLGEPAHRYDFSGNLPMVVSADGKTFVFMSPVPVFSTDRGVSWVETKGLPVDTRPVPDRVNPLFFYALDFATSELYVSRDGARSFQRIESVGLPNGITQDRPANRERRWPLIAKPGREGDLWLVSRQGLYHSTDGGQTFGVVEARTGAVPAEPASALQVEQVSFGKAAPGSDDLTLFAIGTSTAVRAIWRSDDDGMYWYRINDDQHEYGRRFRTLAGDMQQHGRVFLATDGRGILVGEPVETVGSGVKQYTLENDQLRYKLTPGLGGRGLSFSVPGYDNLLRVGEAVTQSPDPVIAADGENYPYLGHIVWIGPQSDWWSQQSLNPERRGSGAQWPPDPYTVLVRNEVVSADDKAIALLAPASAVTGLALNKQYRLEADRLVHRVEAVNTRPDPVSWDIWFNTRVGPGTQVYVPVNDPAIDIRLETFAGDAAAPDAERLAAGYFDFKRGGTLKAKAYIQPSAGWLAAFSAGQLFVIEFERQPLENIHPAQAQVELYLDADPESGLLELEVHGPYRTLQAGDRMTATEYWRAWPSAAESTADQLAELRRRGYTLSD